MSTPQDDYNKPEQLAQNPYPVVPHPPFGNQPIHHGYPRPPHHHQGQATVVNVSNQQNMGMPMHPPPGQPYPGPQGPPQMNAYPMGPGTGHVPSGYPAHALPGNVGTMRFPTYPGQYPNAPPMVDPNMHHMQQPPMVPPNPPQDQQLPFAPPPSEPSDPTHSQPSHQPNIHPSEQQQFYPNSYPEHNPEPQHDFHPQYQYGYNGPEQVNYGPNYYMKDTNIPMSVGQNTPDISQSMPSQPHPVHNVAPHPMPQPPQPNQHPHHQMPHPPMPQQFVNNTPPFENPHAQHMNPEYSYQQQHIMGANPRMQMGPPNRFPCPPRPPFPPMNPNVFPRGNDPQNQSPRPFLHQDGSNWQNFQENTRPNMIPQQGYPPNMQGVPQNFIPQQNMPPNIIPPGMSQAGHPQSSFGGMGNNGFAQHPPAYYTQATPTPKQFENPQTKSQQQNKQLYNRTSPQKSPCSETHSGSTQMLPGGKIPNQNKIPVTKPAEIPPTSLAVSSSPSKIPNTSHSMNTSSNTGSIMNHQSQVPIPQSPQITTPQQQGQIMTCSAGTPMSSQNSNGQGILIPPAAPEYHTLDGKATTNPQIHKHNLDNKNYSASTVTSPSFQNAANPSIPQQASKQKSPEKLAEPKTSSPSSMASQQTPSSMTVTSRIPTPSYTGPPDSFLANTHAQIRPNQYGAQHSQVFPNNYGSRGPHPSLHQGQLRPQGMPRPHFRGPRPHNTNGNQGGHPPYMMSNTTGSVQSMNLSLQNPPQPLPQAVQSTQPAATAGQPSLGGNSGPITAHPQTVMIQPKYPESVPIRPPPHLNMATAPQRMMGPQMAMMPQAGNAPAMVFPLHAPQQGTDQQRLNASPMVMVSQAKQAQPEATQTPPIKRQPPNQQRLPMQAQNQNTQQVHMAPQRLQAPHRIPGPQLVMRPNSNQGLPMNQQRMQAPQMATSQRMPPPIAMQSQRMQAPQMAIQSQPIQTPQGVQPPQMIMTSEGMQMSQMVMASQSSQVAFASQGMENPPMVMQTPPMMVTSQGMQVPQMVMTSQGLQQPQLMMTPQKMQTPPLVMASQGMQAPTMVIASQGMPTAPLIMASQGIQAAPMPIQSQKIQAPAHLQNAPRGQLMMGPPRPPITSVEMQPRALVGQRPQGMMMAPRGVPHPRMFNPEGMHMIPRQPGMFPFRGTIPMNFGNPPRQQIPIQVNQQDQQIITSQPTQIIPMSMAIQGSIQNQPGMQMIPPGAMISSSASTNVGSMMIPSTIPVPQGKISVPWGWKRLLLSDKIVYFSPSGIQLKSSEEIKEYLFTEGTCKCGLDCPIAVDSAFDFNPQKISEMALPNSISVKNRGCKHVNSTIALAQIQSNTGFAVRHYHSPVFNKSKDGQKKKVKKKKKPFSGVLVSQMLAAREAEKQRINEIIAQQKAQHEASLGQKESPKSKAQNEETKQINAMQGTEILQQNLTESVLNESASLIEDCNNETNLSIMENKFHGNESDIVSQELTTDVKDHTEQTNNSQEPEENIPSNPSTPAPTEMPKSPAPHLTPRMVHPAMLQTSKLMNLGNAAQIFGSENFCSQVLSPKNLSRRSSLENTPTGPQEAQRPFSLAEAMQAARRLNLDQAQGSKDVSLEHSNSTQSEPNLKPKFVMHDEKDIKPDENVLRNEMAVNKNNADISAENCDNDNGLKTCKSEQDAKSANSKQIEDSNLKGEITKNSPVKTKIEEKSDLARNIEIRRLSNTDEGNKVLEPTFHSPEKDKKKNPLENIFNIVSGMEVPAAYKLTEDEKDTKGSVHSRNSSPGLSGSSSPGMGAIRPQLKGRKNRQYSTLPPLPHSPPPWVLGGQQLAQGQNMPQMLSVQNIRGVRPPMLNEQFPMFQQPVQMSQTQSIPISGPQPIMTSSSTQMIITAPPLQLQPFVPPPVSASPNIGPTQIQPMMQLIQTVNGPMLVPMSQPISIENGNLVQIQPAPSPVMQQTSPAGSGASSKSSSPGSIANISPNTKKKGRKRKNTETHISPNIAPTSQVPLLMSPNGNLMSFQTFPGNPPPSSSGQVLALSQPTQGSNILTPTASPQVVPQNILVNQPGQQMILSNGTLMTVPQPQGIMYQQLPDGTLVQVQNQFPLLPQGGQQIIAGAPLQGQIMMANPGQIIQGNAPQFIMTPQGLVQAIGPLSGDILPTSGSRQIIPGQGIQIPRKKPKAKPKRKAKPVRLEPSVEQDPSAGVIEQDSVDETDTSFEEPQPSTSKEMSPRSSIQSNKVDSSGLNATPPHQKEGEFEQLRSKSPGSDLDNSYQDLDTSLDTSRHSKMSGSLTPASNISLLEEKLIISEEDDSDMDIEEEAHHPKFVTSSSKKKKKRKKRSAEDFLREQNLLYDEESMIDSPVVPPEPRDFKVGDVIWGPINGSPSWPGKLVSSDEAGVSNSKSKDKVWVCWFGTRQISQVEGYKLKTLSEGLEAHHRERKKSRRGRKMNTSLEKAIQEAMAELD